MLQRVMVDDRTTLNSSPLLEAYFDAGCDSVSDSLLIDLIAERVEPLANALVRSKLHVSLHRHDERQINHDGFDLVSEIKTQVIDKLTSLKSGNGAGPIENLEAYVRTVAANAANHYLRRKHPNRLRLKNQLRYLLTHDRRFSLWESETDGWWCGICPWQGQWPASKNAEQAGDPVEGLRAKLASEGISPDSIELVDLVALTFEHSGVPFRFSEFVSLVYGLRRITEPIEIAPDETGRESSLEYESRLLDQMEQAEFLKLLWGEIGQLPVRHRAALLLNLRNSHGEGLITLLPLTRIATIKQIAETLEFPVGDLARIWKDLPLDDNAIASHLGLTRQQVINLRQSARATLRRRLNYFEGS